MSNRDMPDICMQHMIASMILDKTATFRSVHDRARMKGPAVIRQRTKVEVVADPRIDARSAQPATRGDRNPMSCEEVVDKARDLIEPVIRTEVCSRLIGKLLALETLRDLRPVLQRS